MALVFSKMALTFLLSGLMSLGSRPMVHLYSVSINEKMFGLHYQTLIDSAVSGESANEIVVAAAVYEIYKNFSEITLGSPVIYIFHRLSSCIFCDMVAVLENGEVAQIGTHAELLKQSDGAYSTLWNARAKHYNEQLNEQLRAAEAQATL